MNANDVRPSGFEARLEAELVKMVTERGAVAPRPAGWRRPALRIGAVAMLAAGAVAVPLVLSGGADGPAYAVVHNPDGSVTVTVHDFQHPKALERKLSETGAPVRVTVARFGPKCRQIASTPWPNHEQTRQIFLAGKQGRHVFTFYPRHVPKGAVVVVEVFQGHNSSGVNLNVWKASAPERLIACQVPPDHG